jgi:hypothetical protein
MSMNSRMTGTTMLLGALISAVAASGYHKRRKADSEAAMAAPIAEPVRYSYETSARIMMRPGMDGLKPLTGAEVVDRVHRLMELRASIDRLAWNSLAAGSLKGPPSTSVGDWADRCMLLVSIGIAFEDMPEVLRYAIDDPEGLNAWGSLLHRTAEAYDAVASAYIPPAWSEHSAAGAASATAACGGPGRYCATRSPTSSG